MRGGIFYSGIKGAGKLMMYLYCEENYATSFLGIMHDTNLELLDDPKEWK